jgi:23S rRNA (adenine2503-C2)-methyltransferase
MELNSLYIDELKDVVKKYDAKEFRAKQLFNFFHVQKRTDIENSNLPSDLIEQLLKNEKINKLEILKDYSSKIDETKKLLYILDDGNIIEGSLIKYKFGYSLCISTQVGCRMGCAFCASTKEGRVRNLTAAEMLSQIYCVENKYDIQLSNVVLMGSGEALDNYDNLIRFLELIHDKNGRNFSYRNLTISSCGMAEDIYRLADKKYPITLALSLHSSNNKDREKIMPITKKYSIEEALEACKYYCDKTNTRLTIEYTLIENENDSDKNVQELSALLKGLKVHINLIPLNNIKEYNAKRPNKRAVYSFKKKLESKGLNVTIRRELGADINASCGQLRRDYKGG